MRASGPAAGRIFASRTTVMGDALEKAIAKAKKAGLRIAPLNAFDLDVAAITTGNISIDHITGVGGLPKGRLTELYGPPSSGKTTTALQTAIEAQKSGLITCYFDYEQAVDMEYCRALGLDIDAPSFLFSQPDSFEQGMNAARDIVDTGELGVVIFDSVGAMATEKELSVETGKSTFADKAKLMAQAMRQLTPIVAKHSVVCIFLNHIQDVIDSSPMGQQLAARGVKRTTTPGGKALKFHASMRIEYKQVGGVRQAIDDALTNTKQDVVTSQKVQVTVVKNKVGPPFRTCEVRARFGKGLSQAYSVLDVLVNHRVLRKETGGVYRFTPDTAPPWMDLENDPKNNWIKGEENMLLAMEDRANRKWLDKLTAIAVERLVTTKPTLAPASIHQIDPEIVTDDSAEAKAAEELLTDA